MRKSYIDEAQLAVERHRLKEQQWRKHYKAIDRVDKASRNAPSPTLMFFMGLAGGVFLPVVVYVVWELVLLYRL